MSVSQIGATLACHAYYPNDGRERPEPRGLYADIRNTSVMFPDNSYIHMN